MTKWPHVPVLLRETVAALAPREGGVYVDCTVGAGGHSEAILQAADCRVIGLDRDQSALAIAHERLAPFAARFVGVHAPFANLENVLDNLGVDVVDGIMADIGVSSLQLDTPERGFSFRAAGPLDMRMDTSAGSPASELINHEEEAELARCIATFGEERHAKRIAGIIVRGRPWSDTATLAAAIAAGVPSGGSFARIHPATRTFQALRIRVNDELGQLERLLEVAVRRLAPGGVLAVITFHSLEDRIVKRFIARESGRDAERDPYGNPLGTPRFGRPGPSITAPPDDPNPRARSARLRTAVRLS
jgi:16S rRNA (cytosine1402-N4)-methyltransferase